MWSVFAWSLLFGLALADDDNESCRCRIQIDNGITVNSHSFDQQPLSLGNLQGRHAKLAEVREEKEDICHYKVNARLAVTGMYIEEVTLAFGVVPDDTNGKNFLKTLRIKQHGDKFIIHEHTHGDLEPTRPDQNTGSELIYSYSDGTLNVQLKPFEEDDVKKLEISSSPCKWKVYLSLSGTTGFVEIEHFPEDDTHYHGSCGKCPDED